MLTNEERQAALFPSLVELGFARRCVDFEHPDIVAVEPSTSIPVDGVVID